MDGLWFLTVEEEFGYSVAIGLDIKVWEKYAHIVVKRIGETFGLSNSGIEGIRELIEFDPLFLNFNYEIREFSSEKMVLRINKCPVLEAMEKAGRKKFVCETTTGLYFKNIARQLNPLVVVHPLKLPPRKSPQGVCCEWLFKVQVN
jgi:hypothetical protein